MAIMLPSVILPEVKSSAERRIFEWFKSAPGTDEWIVLHSLGITTHNKVIYGEIDFLVIAPKLGVFALEVKGGRVKREKGIWYFTNKYGKTDSKSRGPFDQSRDGIFSIMTAIRERLGAAYAHIGNVLFGYGVMFPDILYSASCPDEEQWQIFDERDQTNVEGFIRRLADGSRAKWEEKYGPMSKSKLPSAQDVKYIASLMRGDFDCAVSLGIQLRNAKKELVSLTKEQYRCLDQLEDNPRCLIRGTAGTGKTLLAIEAAQRYVAQGERVALFCFNANLADWLNYHFSKMPETVRPEFVGTLHSFMQQVVKNSGEILPYPHTPENIQVYYQGTLPMAAVQILEDCDSQFDRIVVDEAQDLICENYLNVFDRCLRKGLDRGKWMMFGDFTMQAIYASGANGDEIVKKLEDRAAFARFKLTVNCRNTKQIGEDIQTITGLKVPDKLWAKVEGPSVQHITWDTKEEQCQRLRGLLEKLEKDQVFPEEITVLSPKKREDSVVSALQGWKVKDFRIPQDLSTVFSTI